MSFSRKRRERTQESFNDQTNEGEDNLFFVDREGNNFSEGNAASGKRQKHGQKLSNDDDLDPALKQDLNYLRTVFERFDAEFESDDEKEIFVSNVLKEVIEKFLLLSCTRSGSGALETLLPLATLNSLLPIIEVFGTNTRKMCIHQYASHVTESLIKRTFKIIVEHEEKNSSGDNEDKEYTVLIDWAKSFCAFISNNFEGFLSETYACHIVRILLEEASKSRQFEAITKKYVKKVIRLDNFSELLIQSPPIKFFCSYITILKKLDYKLDRFTRFLTKQIATFKSKTDHDDLPILVTDKTISVLVDSIIENSPSEVFDYLLEFLKKHITNLAKHSVANFVLQKLLKSCKTAEQVECIFDELKNTFEDIMLLGHFGILNNLAQACIQHKTRQNEYIKALESAFGCKDKKVFFQLIATLTRDDYLTAQLDVKFHGSLIIQQLLLFDDPKQISESMLNIETNDIVYLACQQFGTHIVETFFKSKTMKKEVKKKLVDRLQDHFIDLACDKFGSRTLDGIWYSSSIEIRSQIAEELLRCMSKLRTSFFGNKLITNYNLTSYKSNPGQWKLLQSKKNVKKEKLF